MSDHKKGTMVHIAKIIIEITIPPPDPNTIRKIAPACPNIAATSSCSNTNILDKPIGLIAAMVAIIPSIG